MPSKRKKKLSERAAAAQAAQAAAAAAAVPRGRGRETKEEREARRSAEKVLRTHGVEPAAAADDPTGYAHVEQLAELNRRLHTAQQTGPAAAEQYRVPTPSPKKGPAAQRRLAVVDVTLSDASSSSDESESESDGAAEVAEKRAAKAAKRKAAKVAEKQAAKAEKRKSAEAAGGGEAKKKKTQKGPSVTDKSAHPGAPRAAGLLDAMTVSELFTHAREQGVSDVYDQELCQCGDGMVSVTGAPGSEAVGAVGVPAFQKRGAEVPGGVRRVAREVRDTAWSYA
jgi:hypothetical protein